MFTTIAASPPVEVAPATISAESTMHSGHTASPLRSPSHPSSGARSFSLLADAGEQMRPPFRHPFFVVIRNESKGCVPERNQRSTIYLAQPVLQIGDDRRGHEQRPADFEQCRP